MSTQVPGDVQAFHQFLTEHLTRGGGKRSPEELLRQWREERAEYRETVEAIREGLDDVANGRIQSAADFDCTFRGKHNLPPAS